MTTENLYISVVRSALPNERLEQVHSESGQFHDVLIVNNAWVFRFPKTRSGVTRLAAEADLLRALHGRLPLETPDPLTVQLEPPVPGLAFMRCPYLPGVPLEAKALGQLPYAALDDLAGQITGFLHALHAFPLADLPAALPGAAPGEVTGSRDYWLRFYEDVQRRLYTAMRADARKTLAAHFESYLDDSALYNFTPCLCHNDLGGVNILWDPAQGRALAVIDFGQAAVGDPAADLASLSTLGEPFFTRLFERFASNPVDRYVILARSRFIRGTFALQEALSGLDDRDEDAYRR